MVGWWYFQRSTRAVGHPFVRFRPEPAVVGCLFGGDEQTPLSFRAFFLLMGYEIIYLTTHLVDLIREVINSDKRVNYPACFNFDPVVGLLGVCLFCLGGCFF